MTTAGVDEVESTVDGAPDDSHRSAERAARRLLVHAAERALEAKEDQRFDELVDRLAGPRPAATDERSFDVAREARMDSWRRYLAALLILGLIVIISLSVALDSQFAGEYVPLLSGLAGIAIGWLYSGSTSHHVDMHSNDST